MKPLKYVILPALFLCIATAHAQETGRPPGFYLRAGGGFGPVFNAPGWDALVDPLVLLPRSNPSVTFEIEGSLGRHFGLFFQYGYLHLQSDVRAEMLARLSRQFPADLVTLDVYSLKEDEPIVRNPVRGFVGCSYALDYGKWSLQPRVLIGAVAFYPVRADVVLKRPDSNQLSTLTLTPVPGSASAFAAGVGALLQRQVWRRLSVYALAECVAFRSPLGYSYLFENQIDDSEVARSFGIDKPPFFFPAQFHAGLSLRLTSVKSFQPRNRE